jgi:hypothetical protein
VLPRHDAAGDGVGGVEGPQVVATEATVRGQSLALDLEEVDDLPVGVDDAHAMLDGRRDIRPAFGVEAETVARAAPERFDQPFTAAVGEHALQTLSLDDHDVAGAVERDAVAEIETGREAAQPVAVEDHHTRRVLHLRRVVTRVGEVHVAVRSDREIVRCVQVVLGEVRDPPVRRRELQARRRGPVGRRFVEQADLGEVDPAVLGHDDRSVGRERGPVRAPAGVGELHGTMFRRPHAVERALGDAGDDERARLVTGVAPHRSLRERDAVAHDLSVCF